MFSSPFPLPPLTCTQHKQVVGNCRSASEAPSVPLLWDCTLYIRLCLMHYYPMRYTVQIHGYTHKWECGCVNCAYMHVHLYMYIPQSINTH